MEENIQRQNNIKALVEATHVGGLIFSSEAAVGSSPST
jgi:hypothetical protein